MSMKTEWVRCPSAIIKHMMGCGKIPYHQRARRRNDEFVVNHCSVTFSFYKNISISKKGYIVQCNSFLERIALHFVLKSILGHIQTRELHKMKIKQKIHKHQIKKFIKPTTYYIRQSVLRFMLNMDCNTLFYWMSNFVFSCILRKKLMVWRFFFQQGFCFSLLFHVRLF